MDTPSIAATVAVIALLLNFVSTFFSGGWKMAERLIDMEASLRKAISDSKLDIELRQDDMRREFGETVAAVRQKLHDVELYASSNYIRSDSFYLVKSELSAEIKALGEKLDSRIEKFEVKLDALKGPIHSI